MHKSGFVNIIGNPNVGKSTLMNALVGEKLSIITSKAQTTRHRIMGIVSGEDFQIVYSDTPGILKPSYKLQESMMKFVTGAVTDADVILYVTDTVEQGDALRGKVLYLNREDVRLEEGQVFLQDLIGLKAIDGTTGREYGVLQEVLPTGANDVYRIVDGAGKEYLFPAVKHMIQEISLEEGVIRLLPIPGIFDQEGEEA